MGPGYPTDPTLLPDSTKTCMVDKRAVASYWNDFLFNNILTSNGFINHFVSVMKLWNAFTNFTTIIPCIKIENFNDFLLYFNRDKLRPSEKNLPIFVGVVSNNAPNSSIKKCLY